MMGFARARQRSNTQRVTAHYPMGYIIDLEHISKICWRAWMRRRRAEVIHYVKQTVIESYRNGITAAKMTEADKEAERKTRTFAKGKR